MAEAVRGCVLWSDPLVVYTIPIGKDVSFTTRLADRVADRPAIIFVLLAWCAESARSAQALANDARQYEARYPRHKIVYMCNTEQEVAALKSLDVAAAFFSHNIFVDYNVFMPVPGAQKQYKAIYNAQLNAFKRHELCKGLSDVAFLYHSGGPANGAESRKIYDRIREQVVRPTFVNELKNPDTHPGLSKPEVNAALNAAHVGLCLSATEGAMHASIEYLYAGLPIVSTVSKGGRDLFFEAAHTRIVPAEPSEIAAAIDDLIAADIDPRAIRAEAIRKVDAHRDRFVAYMQSLLAEHGVHVNYREHWNRIFVDKLLHYCAPDVFYKKFVQPA